MRAAAEAIPTGPGSRSVAAVAAALKCHADVDGQSCYPSIETLACEAGVAARTVTDVIVRMRDAGLVTWKRQGRTNQYDVAGLLTRGRVSRQSAQDADI